MFSEFYSQTNFNVDIKRVKKYKNEIVLEGMDKSWFVSHYIFVGDEM
jgi:hypothetical protein